MDAQQMEHLIREVYTAAIEAEDFHLMDQHPGLVEVKPDFEAAAAAFSERKVRFPLQFTDGVEWVATRMIESGRHTAEIMGYAPTGNEYEFEVLLFHRIEDGLIIDQHSQADSGALMRALGITMPGEA